MPAGGNIINIGMAGLEGIRANTRGTDYYVSKTGLLVLTRALAEAYAPRDIRVNMVSPGQLDNSSTCRRPTRSAGGCRSAARARSTTSPRRCTTCSTPATSPA